MRLGSASGGRLCCWFWSIFLVIKAKQDQINYFFHLMYCVNDFLTDFIRRLKSSDRYDGNENSMFMCPLGLLEQNFTVVAHTHNLGASGDRAHVGQQPWLMRDDIWQVLICFNWFCKCFAFESPRLRKKFACVMHMTDADTVETNTKPPFA